MEKLISRILIKHVEGATIAYLYNREAFDLLGIEVDEYDNSKFLEMGKEFEYEGTRFKIENINFKLTEGMNNMTHGDGINLYSPSDPSDFNGQIGVFVSTVQ